MKNLLFAVIMTITSVVAYAGGNGNGNGNGTAKKATILHVHNQKTLTIGVRAVRAHLENHAGDEMMILFEGTWYTETEFNALLDAGLGDNNGNGDGNASRDDD